MLEANKTLLVDILQAAIPEAQGTAVGVETVIAPGEVEGVTFGLTLRQVSKHRDELFITGFVTQAGGTQVSGL
ncbi:hypothetical protein D3C80_1933700 [compost metagenome]